MGNKNRASTQSPESTGDAMTRLSQIDKAIAALEEKLSQLRARRQEALKDKAKTCKHVVNHIYKVVDGFYALRCRDCETIRQEYQL